MVFTQHANGKFEILRRRGFPLTRDDVLVTIRRADKVEGGYAEQKIYQRGFDATHVLRVVTKETDVEIKVITFYPGRRSRYESKV